MACWAACCGFRSGRAGSFFSLNDASAIGGWVSSPGKAKRGAGIWTARTERPAGFRGAGALYSNRGSELSSASDVVSVGLCETLTAVVAGALQDITTAWPPLRTRYAV